MEVRTAGERGGRASAEEAGDCSEKARGPREGQAQMGLVDSHIMGTHSTPSLGIRVSEK